MEVFGRELTTEEIIRFVRDFAAQTRHHKDCHDCLYIDMALALADALESDRRAAPENKALTLDELRQMDGEPVFVASPGAEEYGHWAIVAGVDDSDGDKTLYCNGDFTCRDYGKTWLAYARKPEGSEP